MFELALSVENSASGSMECCDEEIEEPHQTDVDYVNDDAEMIDVVDGDEESVVTGQKDLCWRLNPFDSDDSLDDYDFTKYMKRSQSQSSSEDEEESNPSDVHSSHSYEDDAEAAYENAFLITPVNEFEQVEPSPPSEEYDDEHINGICENDIHLSHSYDDDREAMYEDTFNRTTQSAEVNQGESSLWSREYDDASINSDDEYNSLDKDYVPTQSDEEDKDSAAEINSDSDDYEDQEDGDLLYCG